MEPLSVTHQYNSIDTSVVWEDYCKKTAQLMKLECNYMRQKEVDFEISKLDPLELNEFFVRFPELNKLNNPSLIINQVIVSSDKAMSIQSPNQKIACACLRDLGMLASSLTKHKIEISVLPYLEDALDYFSGYAGEVPRDTFFSYVTRNPTDKTRRKFTNLLEEEIFIDSLREGMKNLHVCVNSLDKVSRFSIFDALFSILIDEATQAFQSMIDVIMIVKKKISPEVFSFQIRPYFEPYKVKGIEYTAPGASSMPVNLIDKLLWANKIEDEIYEKYFEKTLSYMPFSYRHFASQIEFKLSISTQIFKETDNQKLDINSKKSIQAVINLLNAMLKFRCPHKRIVDVNFKLRGANFVGSGGYEPNFLDYLIQNNFNLLKKLKTTIAQERSGI